jgi:hypothetical protein
MGDLRAADDDRRLNETQERAAAGGQGAQAKKRKEKARLA